jgi:ribosomal protein S18 acetylase RimI-like enzyme
MKDSTIVYRKAIPADVIKLSVLYKQVYIKTYGVEGVSDEFANFITVQFSPERLADTITNGPSAILVAEYAGNLVGVAEIEFGKKSHAGNVTGAELNKLYILDWFCGRGIGQRLLEEVENLVKTTGETLLWLWVLETNERAISFYRRSDFTVIGDASFKMEANTYNNRVMVKKI